jgi:hypothetical protein
MKEEKTPAEGLGVSHNFLLPPQEWGIKGVDDEVAETAVVGTAHPCYTVMVGSAFASTHPT